jgi:hypothetical protein
MKVVTVKQALQQVADHPNMATDDLLNVKVHELVARSLFEIANGANLKQRGTMARANLARQMILMRMVGRRRAGSHPATNTKVELDFVNLTGEAIGK